MKRIVFSMILTPVMIGFADGEGNPSFLQFHQKIGSSISLDLSFRNHEGATVSLRDYFSAPTRPVLLVPGYVRCEMLCAAVSDGLLRALQPLPLSAGRNFQVLYVSIDPHESEAEATTKKRTWVKRYGRIGCDDGVAYLRGNADDVATLMHEIGFEYQYNESRNEYEHPAGFVVLSGEGIITHYQLGVAFSARELEEAINNAQDGRRGSLVNRFLLICSHYNPIRSKYGDTIMTLLRLVGCGVIIGLVLAVKGRRRLR